MLITLLISLIIGGVHAISEEEREVGLRLVGGTKPHEGNVQILFNYTTWKHICDDEWGIRDAKVVCKQLGYAKALKATLLTRYPLVASIDPDESDYNSTYWSTRLQCEGDETNIRNCNNGEVREEECRGVNNFAGVVCTNETTYVQTNPKPSKTIGNDLELRLVGQSEHGFISSGYLEVLHDGVWGAVCADTWAYNEDFVTCGNLGYPSVDPMKEIPSRHNHVVTHYWMRDVKCSGLESKLVECKHSGWKRHVCHTNKPVYLNCKRSPFLRDNRFDKALISNHNLRIRSGYRHSEGRAEIFHDGLWGSICQDKWSIKNANVFCREIGFGSAFEATHAAAFGQGSGKVWLDEVKCKGNENSLEECKHAKWGKSDCGHKEDAGVKCHYPYGKPEAKFKLYSAKPNTTKYEGQIRVLHNGRWKGICGIEFSIREAGVICRQLGLGYPKKAMSTTHYGMVRQLGMFNVKCSGDELSLSHCDYKGPSSGRCRYYDIASVECTPNAPDLVMDVKELENSVRIDTRSLESLGCAYEENCLGSDAKYQWWWPDRYNRTLLRFSARFWNRGTTTFYPNVKKEYWEWHACHQHYHSMERFSDYDLISMEGLKVGEGHKASFCIEDYECEKGVRKKFRCKNKGDQGLQVNCADNYKSHLDCQWIDISRLKFGRYKLRIVLNPQNLVYETDYTNNIATCEINYKKDSLTAKNCHIEPCEQMSHGGKGDGACCRFPFVYKGRQYHTCTTAGGEGYLWCATTSNFDKDGLWGKCR